jgi:hypothetical protein
VATTSVHGSKTSISVGAQVVGGCNASGFTYAFDSHDTTAYGATAHAFAPGLQNNKFTMSGWYDTTSTTGSRAVFIALANDTSPDTVAIIRYPEGNASGKPSETFAGVLTNYAESSPVADIVTWQADFQVSGNVTLGTVGA